MVNFVLQGTTEDPGATVMVRGKPVRIERIRQATTLAEMEAEMEAVFEGTKDGHDLQVEDYERAIRQAVQKRKEAAAARRHKQMEMDQLLNQAGIGGTTKLVGYSQDQLAALGGKVTRASGVKSTPSSSAAQRLFNKYLEKPVEVGHLNQSGVPEARVSRGNLQDQVQGRKPSLRSEAMKPDSVRKPDGN